jgi:tetratricopeptide (TPR) repeat protein
MKSMCICVSILLILAIPLCAQGMDTEVQEYILMEKEGRFEEAMDGYRGYLTDHPDHYPVAMRLINLLFRTKRYSEIISCIGELSETLQERREIITFLGRAYIYSGKRKKGIEVIKTVIQREGEGEKTYGYVGNTFLSLGMIDEAVKVFQEGRRKHGERKFSRELYYCFLRKENYPEALREIILYCESNKVSREWVKKEIVRLVNSDRSLLEELEGMEWVSEETRRLTGEVFLELGDLEKAKSILIEVFDVQSLLHFAAVCIKEDYYSEAEETLQEILNGSAGVGEKEEAQFLLSKVLILSSRFDEALEVLERIIENGYSFSDSAIVEKARLLIEHRKEYKSGIACIEPLLKNKSLVNRAGILKMIVTGYINMDRLVEGESTLRTSTNPYSFYLLGEILFLQGRYEEARKTYLSGVAKCLEEDFANDALEKVLIIESFVSRADFISIIRDIEDDLWKEKYGEGIEKINSSFGRFPETEEKVVLLFYKGMIFARMGRMNEAVSSYTSVREQSKESPFSPKALYRAAVIYKEEIKNIPLAENLFREIVFEYPESVEAELARSELELSQ